MYSAKPEGVRSLMEMSAPELAEALKTADLAVMSCASIEPHGPHLPLATDSLQGQRVTKEIAQRLVARGTPAIAGPTIPFGMSTNRYERSLPLPGNVSVRPDTLKRLLTDITHAMQADGFRRFVWIMSHVENEAVMHVTAKELADTCGAKILVLNWIQPINDVYPDVLRGGPVQGHAGEGETARMLAIAPELVNLNGLETYYPPRTTRRSPTAPCRTSAAASPCSIRSART